MSSTLKKEIKRLRPDICKCDCVNCKYDFKCLTENTEKELQLLNAENIELGLPIATQKKCTLRSSWTQQYLNIKKYNTFFATVMV